MDAPICYEWVEDNLWQFFTTNAVSFLIVGANYFLRIILIAVIKLVKYKTISEETRAIMNGVFITQFFNTAMLLLLVNANLQESGLPFGSMLSGQYPDFTGSWYKDIGVSLVKTMTMNSVFPAIEWGIFWSMATAKRFWDKKKFSFDPKITRKTAVEQYVDLYSGPAYMMHFKYSTIMNNVFVALMFGPGVPLLYPVCIFSLFILYVVERLSLAFYYKQPPMFDEKMSASTYKTMRWAIALNLFFAYWMYSNKQMFSNEVHPLRKAFDVPLTGHVIFKNFEVDQAFPSFLFGFIFLAIFCTRWVRPLVAKFIPSWFPEDPLVKENLGNYFDSLEEKDLEWWTTEEEYIRDELGYKMVNDETLEGLKAGTPGKRVIQNVHCYDILANPEYENQFCYIPVADRDNDQEREQSD